MTESDSEKFGGFTDDVDGDMVTRKVQTGGRINVPDRFLGYIGCGEHDSIIVAAEGGELKIKEATVDSLAVENVMKGTILSMEELYDAE